MTRLIAINGSCDHNGKEPGREGRCMGYWCWQKKDWGSWNIAHLKGSSEYEAAIRAVGRINTISSLLSDDDQIASEAVLLEEESLNTSLIEGRVLDRDSVRASIAKKLGIESIASNKSTRDVDGLIETLTDATKNYEEKLTHERLYRWQASLFPRGRDEKGYPIEAECYRTSGEDMKVVTMKGRKEIVHYIAPPSASVMPEMDRFVRWFNKTSQNPDLMRGAIASYWFVSIHPFEDGNGRVSRAIADMCIAQAERSPHRLYSMSNTLKNSKQFTDRYYENLEACSRGEKPIDEWVLFFLDALRESAEWSEILIKDVMVKAAFWDNCRNIQINARQNKFLNWVLDQGSEFESHIKRQRYARIVGKISDSTAKRDLQDLKEKGVLVSVQVTGRNAGYRLSHEKPPALEFPG